MNILLAGVGGQGTVLASKLLAQRQWSRGWRAAPLETIGRRSAAAVWLSHVRDWR